MSNVAGLPQKTGMAWNPDALAAVGKALASADTAMQRPNRAGCPAVG